jgi:hypothetical protein
VSTNHTFERNEQVSIAQPAQEGNQIQQHRLPHAIPHTNNKHSSVQDTCHELTAGCLCLVMLLSVPCYATVWSAVLSNSTSNVSSITILIFVLQTNKQTHEQQNGRHASPKAANTDLTTKCPTVPLRELQTSHRRVWLAALTVPRQRLDLTSPEQASEADLLDFCTLKKGLRKSKHVANRRRPKRAMYQ